MKAEEPCSRRPFNPEMIWVLAAVIAGIILTLYVFYPGYMSYDSANQLAQGRQGLFTDWNPPVMSWLWGQIDRVVHGPVGMLALFNLLFWIGLGLWISLVTPGWSMPIKALAVLVIGLFPPIFMLLSTIWKDVGMAAALLFASSWLALAEKKKSLCAFLVGLLGIWFALALRHNAVFAAFPLMIYAGLILSSRIDLPANWSKQYRIVMSGVLGLGLLGLLLWTTTLAGRSLTRHSTTYALQQILAHDLVGISIRAHEVLLPDYLTSPQSVTITELKKIYDTQFPVVCLYSGCGVSELKIKSYDTSDLNDQTIHVWIKAVLSHPKAYLFHRIRQWMSQLGIAVKEVCYPYITDDDQNALTLFGIDQSSLRILRTEPALTRAIIDAVDKIKNSLIFRGWIYLAFLTFLIVYIPLTRGRNLNLPKAVIAVASSGWLYGLSYLPLSTTCDFRMHYWTVMAAVICGAAWLGGVRWRK